jgi:hypothetical protein
MQLAAIPSPNNANDEGSGIATIWMPSGSRSSRVLIDSLSSRNSAAEGSLSSAAQGMQESRPEVLTVKLWMLEKRKTHTMQFLTHPVNSGPRLRRNEIAGQAWRRSISQDWDR